MDDLVDVDDFETTLKVIVVGNGGVGKTSLTTRFAKGIWTDSYKKTIGVDFMERTLSLADWEDPVTLMVWDTAGQEVYANLVSRYYRGADAAVLVFSTVDRDSFDALPTWKERVMNECGPITIVLVQNKMDLLDKAVVTPDEVEDMARTLQTKLFRSSVKDNMKVNEVFEEVARRCLLSGAGGEGAVTTIAELAAETQRLQQSETAATRAHAAAAEAKAEAEGKATEGKAADQRELAPSTGADATAGAALDVATAGRETRSAVAVDSVEEEAKSPTPAARPSQGSQAVSTQASPDSAPAVTGAVDSTSTPPRQGSSSPARGVDGSQRTEEGETHVTKHGVRVVRGQRPPRDPAVIQLDYHSIEP
eukprot:CAMPEP_0196771892 /NCGR_PEP_ID=MMETSP1104-20130614/1940_1 /TAXON_ID=33652 /ORGANISM="Cafeteria sp., Strain Caron Lab Isolate" /LENGTH=363 /DNA_ID=CAMNT_0042142023 /DNA_START=33 /DNA_END=1121 /DNA_ORIENTATION=+